MDTKAWSEAFKVRNHLENVGVYRWMILKCIFFASLRVGAVVEVNGISSKSVGNLSVPERLLVFQEVLYCYRFS